MLDNTIDVSQFPLAAQQTEALAKRRIGLRRNILEMNKKSARALYK